MLKLRMKSGFGNGWLVQDLVLDHFVWQSEWSNPAVGRSEDQRRLE
jgi:hypothetical protein